MKKTILQTHIDLLKECKRQNKMLEKLIELNMNDMQDIVDQRDWYYDRYRQLKENMSKDIAELKNLLKVMDQAKHAALQREGFAIEERDEYKIGHDRYEKLRRLSPMQFHELYEKNIKTGERFDTLVDKI